MIAVSNCLTATRAGMKCFLRRSEGGEPWALGPPRLFRFVGHGATITICGDRKECDRHKLKKILPYHHTHKRV